MMAYLCDTCANCKASGYHPDFHDPTGPLRKYVTCHDRWTRWAIEVVDGRPERACPMFQRRAD